MRKLSLRLFCANIILSFAIQAQEITDLTPELGAHYVYRELDINLSDTGSVGTNQIWDYSGRPELSSINYTSTYRVPNAMELIDFPNANFVNEWYTPKSITQTEYYVINSDSTALLGFETPEYSSNYLDPFVEYFLPMNSSTNFIDTCDNRNSTIQPSIITNETSFQGSGTLITPYGTYENALKFKSFRNQFYSFGSSIYPIPFMTVEFYYWLHPEYKTIIFQIFVTDNNEPGGFDYSNLTLMNVSPASIDELSLNSTYLSPNPTSSNFKVISQNEYENFVYEIVDMNGKQVMSGKGMYGDEIYTEKLISGIYTIRLVTDTSLKTIKLVKL